MADVSVDVSRKKEKKSRVWSEIELKFLAIVLADEKTNFGVKLDTLALKNSSNNEVFEQLGTFMGFTIIAVVMAVAMLISYSFALAGLEDCIREIREPPRYLDLSWSKCYDIPGYSPGHKNLSRLKAGIGIDSVLLTIAVLEFAVGLASSIYCCAAICSCCNSTSRVQGTQPVVFLQATTMGQVSTAGGRMAVISGVPPSTANVVQPQQEQFIVQGPVQPYKEQEAPPAYN